MSPIPASGARWSAVATNGAYGVSDVVRKAVKSCPTQHVEYSGLRSRNPAPVARLRGWGQPADIAYSSVWSQVGCCRETRCLWCVCRGRASRQKSPNAACGAWWAPIASPGSRGASEGVGPASRYLLFQRLEPGGLQSRKAVPMACLTWWGQPSKVAQRSMGSQVGMSFKI